MAKFTGLYELREIVESYYWRRDVRYALFIFDQQNCLVLHSSIHAAQTTILGKLEKWPIELCSRFVGDLNMLINALTFHRHSISQSV